MEIYSSKTHAQGTKRKKARAIIGTDWLFLIGFTIFSVGAIVLYVLTEYGERWNINIKDESDGPIGFVLAVGIIFGLIAIVFAVLITSKLIINHKLRKAERIGQDIVGKVVNFKCESVGKYRTTRIGYSYDIKTEINYTYYAIIEYVNEKGETVKYTDYTPLTKDQINRLLEIKSVHLKSYKNVCLLNHDFELSGAASQTDYVKEQNQKLVEENGPIKRNFYETSAQRNKYISCYIVIAIAIIAAISTTIVLYRISPLFILASLITPLTICIIYIYLLVKSKRNYNCLKFGNSQKAKTYSISYDFPFGARIKTTFVNKQGEEKTCVTKINKFQYGKINDAKELYVLVYHNYAFPDLDKLEEHMREIK